MPASKCTNLLNNERYTHDLRNVFLFVVPMVVKAVDMLRHSDVLPISVCYFEVAKRFFGLDHGCQSRRDDNSNCLRSGCNDPRACLRTRAL